MEDKNRLLTQIDNLIVFLLGLAFLVFPLIISTVNTDAFSLPKQITLAVVGLFALVFFGIKALNSGGFRIRRTPFDLPILLLTLAFLLSALFSINRWESLISFVPFLYSVIVFFAIVNFAKGERHFFFLSSSLVISSSILSVFTVLNYFKIYLLPVGKVQAFSLFGNLLDQAMFLGLIFSLCLFLLLPFFRKFQETKRFQIFFGKNLIFLLGGLLTLLGLLFTLLMLFTIAKPQLLPYAMGFQIAFAAISQDVTRIVQAFLFGSGYGTFLSDFTKFKPATINLSTDLWSISFVRSSSFLLEILATTGVLGFLSLIFLGYKILRLKPLFLPLILGLILMALLPFSFMTFSVFIILLGLVTLSPWSSKENFYEEEIKFVSFRKGVLALSAPSNKSGSLGAFSLLILAVFLLIAAFLSYFSFKFIYSDFLFQKSLTAAASNDAQSTYNLQTQAINTFPYRDGYYRIFSQVNLTLANNLVSSIPENSSPSAQVQQNLYTLIQQSINNARSATSLSPLNAFNWNNLSGIYRSLIGFGQNADTFAIVAQQQAITLDPNNPQEYIVLGGIFYQLSQWDNAINQFQIAINLKPDFANAYYNLGHALEQKGDNEQALQAYQAVRSLVANDKQNLEQINKEIAALEKKVGTATANPDTSGEAVNQPDLNVATPEATLPPQNPPVKIPAPTATGSAR